MYIQDKIVILSLLCGPIACAGQPDYRQDPALPATVPAVDLERYSGLWYEIARYPNRFEKNCAAVTARYQLRVDGKITVTNTCHEGAPDGPMRLAQGEARSTNPPYNTQLKVRFAPRIIPFAEGDYWIFYLTTDYDVALVGDPEGKYLWILARTKILSESQKADVLEAAQKNGFETAPLKYTLH